MLTPKPGKYRYQDIVLIFPGEKGSCCAECRHGQYKADDTWHCLRHQVANQADETCFDWAAKPGAGNDELELEVVINED